MLLIKKLLDDIGIRKLTDEEEDEYFDRLSYIRWHDKRKKQLSPEQVERESRALDDKLRVITQGNNEFERFEGHINKEYGIGYDKRRYPNYLTYVSSLFLVDILEQSFRKGNVRLPNEMSALDVGAGDWRYCISLLRFLEKFEGERKVELLGVDYDGVNHLSLVKQMTEALPARYVPGNIMKVPQDQEFDLIFMAHMVVRKYHCKEHKVPYIGEKRLFNRIFELLKSEGLLVVSAYNWAGENSIVENIPEDKLVVPPFSYHQPVKSISNFFDGYYSFDNNCIAMYGKK